jgi:hypothetical protein
MRLTVCLLLAAILLWLSATFIALRCIVPSLDPRLEYMEDQQ